MMKTPSTFSTNGGFWRISKALSRLVAKWAPTGDSLKRESSYYIRTYYQR
jgi:hypothetical protein